MDTPTPSGVDLVNAFLRGQNLEQIGKDDEAIALYELAVAGAFDAPGPYDRLIAIYSNRAMHLEVVRVAEAALAHVHTYAEKRAWFERMRREASAAYEKVPRAAPKPRG
ncbi:MAG TPA: hypothetical protein VG408_03620 [Actinomycetota bacterium]|nr:hypothetical protein [Actinomycetota bacterium]